LLSKDPQTEQLLALARAFKEPKEISMTVHLPVKVVQMRMAIHGYHRHYITEIERRWLAQKRRREDAKP
jgi:hypothetical protein